MPNALVSSQTNTDPLLLGLKNQDEASIKRIYSKLLPLVISFVKKNRGNAEDARDIFSMVLMALITRLQASELNIASNFEGYLFTACKNQWRKELQKREKQRVTSDDVRHKYYNRDAILEHTLILERQEIFKTALQNLSENCKQILDLFFAKLSGTEIMEELGYASETTVRQRIFKCKTMLSKLVQKDPRFVAVKTV